MYDYQNFNITNNIGTDALDTALEDGATDSVRTRAPDTLNDSGALDELISSLEQSVADLEDVSSNGATSASSSADGELTGNESLGELFDELDDAKGELADALDEAGSGKGSSALTPQDFQKQLSDIAGESEDWSAGEDKMLEQGKRLMNATPEQQQAFLDKAKELMGGSDATDTDASPEDLATTEISGREASELEGFADGLLNSASQSSGGADGAESDKANSFTDKVERLLKQSGDDGPGEQMARDAAKMLADNPPEDQQAFLEQLEKLLNNADEDHGKDIDETNHNEGKILKKMAEALEELPSDRGESSGGSSGSNSSLSDSGVISALLDHITSKSSDGGREITPKEATALRALLEDSEAETT
jgi:hypothetical protein